MKKQGFTLIELLVVIAIIGILSGVVLTSLGTARNKAKAGAVKSEMASVRSQAEIYFDTNSNYGDITSCSTGAFSDDQVVKIVAGITTNGGTAQVCTSDAASGSNDTKWAYSVTLPGTSAGSWCVDSNGAAEATTDTNTDGDCGA